MAWWSQWVNESLGSQQMSIWCSTFKNKTVFSYLVLLFLWNVFSLNFYIEDHYTKMKSKERYQSHGNVSRGKKLRRNNKPHFETFVHFYYCLMMGISLPRGNSLFYRACKRAVHGVKDKISIRNNMYRITLYC